MQFHDHLGALSRVLSLSLSRSLAWVVELKLIVPGTGNESLILQSIASLVQNSVSVRTIKDHHHVGKSKYLDVFCK